MEPINYMALVPQINAGQRFAQGLGTIKDLAQLEALGDRKKQAKMASEDLTNFFNKPNKTVDDYEQMRLKYPSMSEALTASYKNVNEEKKLNDFNIASQISGALNGGNPDLAKQILTKEKEAYLNSGDTKGVSSMDNILKSIDTNPSTALEMSNMFMASIYPDKFKDTYEGIIKSQQAPLEMKKTEAEIINKMKDSGLKDAQIAKTWREYQQAPIETNIKLQNLALDKENSKIRMIEAQLRNTDNELKREELQLKIDEKNLNIEKLKKETEQANNQLLSTAKDGFNTIDSSNKLIDKILISPGLELATGATSISSSIPGTEAKNVASLVETLKSQAFLTQIEKMKGLGQLTETEGARLVAAVGNLDMSQTKEQFQETLKDIKDKLNKSKVNLEIKYKNQLPEIKSLLKAEEEQRLKTETSTSPQVQTVAKPRIITAEELKKMGGGIK